MFLLMRQGVRAHVARRTPYFGGSLPAPVTDGPSGPTAPSTATTPPAAAPAVAHAGAPLREVREAVLITGTTMRLAPSPGGGTFVETAPSADPQGGRKGMRTTLLGEGGLPRLAATFSRGEKWPVLVAAKEGADYTLHLYRDGRLVAAHVWWADPAEMPTQQEAAQRATALTAAYGKTDHRPPAAALRGTGDPRHHLDEAFAALGMPTLSVGFGRRPEPLAEARGAQLVERRSFLRVIKESLSAESDGASGGELPPLS
jgi:hypothetical protein